MIAVKPKPWTRHHTNRLYHLSMAMCFGAAALMALLISASAYLEVNAEQATVTGTVTAINSGPTVIIPSGGAGAPVQPSVPSSPDSDLPMYPKVDLNISPQDMPPDVLALLRKSADQLYLPKEEIVTVDGRKLLLPIYPTQFPDFWGKTNIPNADIHLEIYSEQIIRATTSADKDGYWAWRTTEAISPGAHTLFIIAQHPQQPEIKSSTEKMFVVRTTSEVSRRASPEPLKSAPGNQGVLFDVFIKIQKASKQIPAGEEVIAALKLINFGAAGNPVDVPVEYTIEDSEGKVVMTIKETIAVATQISILKSFYTSTSLAEGTYTLIARAPTKDAIAVAADTFEVKGEPVIALTEETRVNFSVIFQALIALFSLFCIVTYFEYNKVVALTGTIKRVSEADFKNN